MKTKNSMTIGLSILTLFTLSGCVTKTIHSRTPYIKRDIPIQNINKRKNINKRRNINKRKNRVYKKTKLPISTQLCTGDNCKASIFTSKGCEQTFKFMANNQFKKENRHIPVIESIYNKNVSESLTDTPRPQYNNIYNNNIYDDDPYVSDDPYISYNKPKSYPKLTPKIKQYSQKVSIQVGAFRRYTGAKIYAKRYGLLSRQYKTIIKKESKDNKPIYRVRIEGFANSYQAKAFMSRYNLNGAFLVRK